jgi:hypothetical protein
VQGATSRWVHCVADPLLKRSVCAAGQPARIQVSRCVRLSGSDRDFPALTGLSGTRRARPLRPELAAPLGVCPSPLLGRCAGGRAGWRLSGDVAVLCCCTAPALSAHVPGGALPRRPSPFRPDVSPSRHAKCECSCVLPTADVCRWLVLLLSRLLSGHRWPDAAPASDAGNGHYQAPSWSLR